MKQVRLQIGIPRAGSSAKSAEDRSRQEQSQPSTTRPITMRAATGRSFSSMAEMEAAARGEVWKATPDPVAEVAPAAVTTISQPRNDISPTGLLRSVADRLQSLFRSSSSPDSGNGQPPTQR